MNRKERKRRKGSKPRRVGWALRDLPLLHPEPSAHPLRMRRSCGAQGDFKPGDSSLNKAILAPPVVPLTLGRL